ncbi:MAG: CSLREA domain-containing protein, partial [Bacteroidetes bacterium]|nr:CSLREA domain-containing protein [Bacteroidota bacterium]
MKKFHQAFSIQFFVLFLILIVPVVSAQTFVVTETDDPTPDGCSSGTDCSLREAIIAANDVGSGTATIQLAGGQTYTLSIENPSPENDFDSPDETAGSLKILNTDAKVRLEATGTGMATIDADGIDRVFIIYNGTDVEIDEIEITGGDPENGQGGGIFVFNNIDLEITNSSITGNTAINSSGFGYGGGMWAEGIAMSITGSTISNNTAGFMGGGLRIIQYDEEVTVDSDVTIENSTISNNDGDDWSGGIHTENSDLTIIESRISQNQGSIGGGIRISSGNVTINRSTIDGNIGSLGGGLDIDGGEVLIINSTISGNEAENFNGAGGIYAGNFSNAVIDIVNTTITNNKSGTIGGVIRGMTGASAQAVINFTNSIVANQDSGDDCSGTITSNGNNLSSDDTCSFTETGDLENSDPLLGPLQDNGGPVFTHAISGPLSPAVNNGSNALYTSEGGGDLENDLDASGNDRVYDFAGSGIIDIGSFELQQDATFEGCPVTNEDKILFVKKGESGTGANWADALGEL